MACQLLYPWLLAFAILWLHPLVSLLASLIYYVFIQTWGQASVASSKKASFQILELLFSNNWVVDFLHKVQCDAKHYILIWLSVHCCIPISGPEWALGVNLLPQGTMWAISFKSVQLLSAEGPHFSHLTPCTGWLPRNKHRSLPGLITQVLHWYKSSTRFFEIVHPVTFSWTE